MSKLLSHSLHSAELCNCLYVWLSSVTAGARRILCQRSQRAAVIGQYTAMVVATSQQHHQQGKRGCHPVAAGRLSPVHQHHSNMMPATASGSSSCGLWPERSRYRSVESGSTSKKRSA